MAEEKSEPYGFLLVTSDPSLSGGETGVAYELVKERMRAKRWPLYERTRNRDRIKDGSRVAFYVAGTRKHGGRVVGTAEVAEAKRFHRTERTDPPQYMTEAPTIVLELKNVRELDPPVSFQERLPLLSFRPKDLKKWGNLLQGGTRALLKGDWEKLLGRG